MNDIDMIPVRPGWRGVRACAGVCTTVTLFAVVLLMGAPTDLVAEEGVLAPGGTIKVIHEQFRNGPPLPGELPCSPAYINQIASNPSLGWQNGNVNSTQAHLQEGQSLPHRLRLEGLETGPGKVHTVILEYESKHSSLNAIDFLTSWERTDDPLDGCPDPLDGIASRRPADDEAEIPLPDAEHASHMEGKDLCISMRTTDAYGNDCIQPLKCAEMLSQKGVRQMSLWNGVFVDPAGGVLPIEYHSVGQVGRCEVWRSDAAVQVIIRFIALQPDVVLAWGAHIASRGDWGLDKSAALIDGSSYHMHVVSVDGKSGSPNRAMATDAVCLPPLCDLGIQGPAEVECGTTQTYTIPCLGAGTPLSYEWNLTGAGEIVSSDGASVVVRAARTCSASFELCATVVSDPADPTCATTKCITVNVVDTTPPVIEPEASDKTVECDGEGNTADLNAWLAARGGASASDVCSAVTWSDDFAGLSDDCGKTGSAKVTFTATDECGNTSATMATFTIVDTTPPSLTVDPPEDCYDSLDAAKADLESKSSSVDLCSGTATVVVEFVRYVDDTECDAVFAITAKDACDNTTTAKEITVHVDSTPPEFTFFPPDMTLPCEDCPDNPDPSKTGEALAWDICDGAIKCFCIDEVDNPGSCPKTITRTWVAEDRCGNRVTRDQIIQAAPPPFVSAVTDSSLCTFGEQFRLILSQDPANPGCYRLNASNPGQFYYNVTAYGEPGEIVTLTLSIPYPFVTQGANPVHAYGGLSLQEGDGGLCLLPEAEFYVASDQITLANYSPRQMGSTYTLVKQVRVPESGFVYLNIHLDYGLKKTGGFAKGANNDAVACGLAVPEILIPEGAQYPFGYLSPDGVQYTDTVKSYNDFKKNPGVGGVSAKTLDAQPVPGLRVSLLDRANARVGAAVTDADGWYMIPYKHSGKAAAYKVTLSLPGGGELSQSVTLKANGIAEANFEVP